MPSSEKYRSRFHQNYLHSLVEYASGNGDYAEWLERFAPMENISAGDIVAVKAGKITKDLEGAEQIMAVSHKPIVLGNTPPKGKRVLIEGNIQTRTWDDQGGARHYITEVIAENIEFADSNKSNEMTFESDNVDNTLYYE